MKVVGIVRPALRAGDDVINLEHGIVSSSTTELADTIPLQNLEPQRLPDRLDVQSTLVPGAYTSLLQERCDPLLTGRTESCPLLEGEILNVERENPVLVAAHAMISEHLERHGPNAFFVITKVCFVFSHEVGSDLAKAGVTSCVEQGADEQRLVDVAHPHLRVDELEQFLSVHLFSVPQDVFGFAVPKQRP